MITRMFSKPARPSYNQLPILDDWHKFVLAHSKAGNLLFHFISAMFFFTSPFFAWHYRQPMLLLPFLCSGLLAQAGHWIFKDGISYSRESRLQLKVPAYVLKMFWQIIRGQYKSTLAEARQLEASSQRNRNNFDLLPGRRQFPYR